MDRHRFDALTKAVAGTTSRRGLLRALAGLTVVGSAGLLTRGDVTASSCTDQCTHLRSTRARNRCLEGCARIEARFAAAEAKKDAAVKRQAERIVLRTCPANRRCYGTGTITCCPSDHLCVDGQCARLTDTVGCTTPNDCSAGQICCGGACVDPLTDPANCGYCTNTCGTSEVCKGGICDCVPGCDNLECGIDSCGAFCGSCPDLPNSFCDSNNQCQCFAFTCSDLQVTCGDWPDGCGGTAIGCTPCPDGQTCNASGQCQQS
jgi:hypothetical protein